MNKKNILNYLHYRNEPDEQINILIDECIKEVKELSLFKCVHTIQSLSFEPLKIKEWNILLDSWDLENYLEGCNKCVVIACTLGVEVDRKIKYYEHIDMTKAMIFDAVCNAYLEECCDEYEKNLDLGKRTFRLAPGYGNIPLELNKQFAKYLSVDKYLNVSINSGGGFVPMKTMMGIIGIGNHKKKTCLSCVNIKNCKLRKEGLTCYVKD